MTTPSSSRPRHRPGHLYEFQCREGKLVATTCPPLPVEWGRGWWIRVEDVWIEIRRREPGETMTEQLARELCELLAAVRGKESRE